MKDNILTSIDYVFWLNEGGWLTLHGSVQKVNGFINNGAVVVLQGSSSHLRLT